MVLNLQLSDSEADALRRRAEQEGRSIHEVARTAIAHYVTDRSARRQAAVDKVRAEDADLLDRLSR